MKKLLGILLFFLFLGTAGLAAGIYLQVLPPNLVGVIPFVRQSVASTQNSNDDPSNMTGPSVAETLPATDVQSNNVQPVITQPFTTNSQGNVSVGANSNLPNNKNNSNLSKVSRIYSGMKPEEAVAILNDLDDKMVITMLQKMDEDQAAKVLALMDPQRAAVLSKMLLQYQGANLNNN